MAWALHDLPSATVQIVGLIITISVVLIVRIVFLYFARARERREEQKWESESGDYSADSTVNQKAIINEARAFREAQKRQNHSREIGDILTLLVLCAGGAITFLQWETLEKTDQTFKLQGRAWIAPRGFVETPPNFRNRVDLYTEATLGLENVGKEPALKVAEEIYPIAFPVAEWNNEAAMSRIIRAAIGSRGCKDVSLNQRGRVIWPGAKPGRIVGFSEEDAKKINSRAYYAMLAGCIVYETLGERHETEVCLILEPVIQDGGWRSINCIVHNQAN